MKQSSQVLILGANSDVAKAMILRYAAAGDHVVAASRSTAQLDEFLAANPVCKGKVEVRYFDAADFGSHAAFYAALPAKPEVVVYAAGYLVQNERAFQDWEATFQMMKVHYGGAVSLLNIIISDPENKVLRKIIGLSSLSGVRGRKSNFVYGSTKAAFSTYLQGLRQELAPRKVVVNIIVAGYIRSKMVEGLQLTESLMLEPDFIAKAAVEAGRKLVIVPGLKWKMIYLILKILPEFLVAKLP